MSAFLAAGGFNPIAFDPSAFVLTWATFLVLLFLLAKFVWKPTLAAIETRETRIEESITAAEASRKHAEELLASYKEQIANVEAEGQALRDKARSDAEALAAELKARAEADAKARIERAGQEIEQQAAQALQDIRKEAVVLGMAVASKVVGRSLDGADQQRLANEVVSGLGNAAEN
jgi:F-type H+-transporting ATPase subunit b